MLLSVVVPAMLGVRLVENSASEIARGHLIERRIQTCLQHSNSACAAIKKDPVVYLLHILDSIRKIEDYAGGLSKKEFIASMEAQDAVIRRLEIIGEAVKNLNSSFKKNYPDIPWKQAAGMCDVLIHEYFGVDAGLVWNTVKKDLEKLKRQIEKIIASNKQKSI